VSRAPSRLVLVAALFALAGLFVAWFHGDRHLAAVLLVFVLPPLLAAIAVLFGGAKAAFWSGVLGLLWFSHGVMVAWSRPAERWPALTEVALALVVVVASSWPGLRARLRK
jgi:uncharacterized membrane protein